MPFQTELVRTVLPARPSDRPTSSRHATSSFNNIIRLQALHDPPKMLVVSISWADLRGEAKAIGAAASLVGVIVTVSYCKQSGPVSPEDATITGFGTVATDIGNEPIVFVRTPDGQRSRVPTSITSLNGCVVGGPVHLLRRRHSLSVAPTGCR